MTRIITLAIVGAISVLSTVTVNAKTVDNVCNQHPVSPAFPNHE